MTVFLIDTNSYYRRRLETARFGQSIPRVLFHESFLPGDTKVYVHDGGNHNLHRRALYPAYKTKRPPVAAPIARGLEFFRELMCQSAATQVQVPTYEADDVLAALAPMYVKAGLDVKIVSNDRDLLAVGVPMLEAPKIDIPPSRLRLYKTLVGKGSDQNSGVPGFGRGAWDALLPGQLDVIEAALRDGTYLDPEIFPKQRGVRTWVQEHLDELDALWTISGFWPVPREALEAGIKPGKADRAAGEAMLVQFFL
jgi:hypothetical protein